MQINERAMFERTADGQSASSLVKEMIAAPKWLGLTRRKQSIRCFLARREQNGERTNNPYKQSHAEFNSARGEQSEEFDIGFANYLKYTGEGDKGSYESSVSGKKELTLAGKRNQANFFAETRQRYFELRQEGLAKVTGIQPRGFSRPFKKRLRLRRKLRQELVVSLRRHCRRTALSLITSNKALYQAASAGNGRISAESIPAAAIAPSTLKAWQQGQSEQVF